MDNNTNNGRFSFGSEPEIEVISDKSILFNLNEDMNNNSSYNRNEPDVETVEAEEVKGSESKRIDDIFESMNNNYDSNRSYGNNNNRYGTNDYRAEEKTTCRFCGETVSKNQMTCPRCGHQLKTFSFYTNIGGIRKKNKWISLILCILLGGVGAHKFYEGKIIMGIVYALTGGLFGIGVIVDFIALLLKTNPYYV